MRVAFFSPFNPQKTGVSDYSEELLPHLARHGEIDLVVNGYEPENASLRDSFRTISPREFASKPGRYDMAVYQLANSLPQHGYMIPAMKLSPGISVLHDYYLHYLMLGLTLMNGDLPALERVLRAKYGERAGQLARKMLLGRCDYYQVSTTVPLIHMSRGVITHSRFGADLVAPDAQGRPVQVIPMGMPLRPLLDPAEMKSRYGFRKDDFVLTSVSTLSHTKRIPIILQAVAALRSRNKRLKFLILGGGILGESTRSLIESLNLWDSVKLTGWQPKDAYWECLNLADAVIDLRYPSGAETSASLLRAMSAGKPLIASAQGSFLEWPDDCCIKVPVDEQEPERLGEAVGRLMSDPDRCQRMGAASRRHVETTYRPDLAAEAYWQMIRNVATQPAPAPAEDYWLSPPSPPVRFFFGSVYKAGRAWSLLRNYGFGETLRRVSAQPLKLVGGQGLL